ncbi:hypothetical protein [Nocardia huaxiensis]|uniref:Uncharacterized protein n=1 Tax=Nocardia huaxiensis TaxID=2755382 RepID=A0A7D6VA38_9NOCA|nr:hypothetical protein [Nocardia huaxiensis]QLY30093.1 hypothetical protein H0264_33760 [Nocardia huaxiensis]UFS96301.1 hypothetical protein LPY97_37690 [Nocardia huaxiensis]
MHVFQEMCALFEDHDLGEPPIPPPFQPLLRQAQPWAYATGDISPALMYQFGYPHDAMRHWLPDQVAVSHSGHGANSYAVNYHLVWGSLTLFAQTGFGGAYMDDRVAAARVRRMFEACRTLSESVENARRCPNHRLVVAYSDIRETSWCRWFRYGDGAVRTSGLGGVELPGDPVAAFDIATLLLLAH